MKFSNEKKLVLYCSQARLNKAELERIKYFFAVTEAKAIEGSAVPMGSNFVTPTQSVKAPVTESIESKRIQAIKGWLLDN